MITGLRLRWNEARRWNDAFNWLGTKYADKANGLRTVLVAVDGPGGTRWFSDDRFAHLDSGLVAEPRIGGEVRFQRRAALPFWGSSRSIYGVGSIELINADGALNGWMFSGLKGSVVRVYFGAPDVALPGMIRVARALVDRVEGVGESMVRLVLADAASELDVPVQTATYSSGVQQGRLIPITIGQCLSVPALQTGAPSLVFSVHDSGAAPTLGGLTAVSDVFDRGAALTTGTQWTASSSGDQHGFTLNQATSGRITAFVRGPSVDPGLFQFGRLPRVVEYLLAVRRGWSSSRFDLAALNALSVETSALFGRYVDSAVTYGQLMTEIGDSISAWWWIDAEGRFQMQRWRLPTGTPVLRIDNNSIEGEVQPEFDAAPGLADAVLSSRNWYVHTPDELAGSVRDTAAGVALTRAYRNATTFSVHDQYAQARGSRGTDRLSSAADMSRPPADFGMPTLLASGVNEAAYRATLYAQPMWFWNLTALLEADAAAALQPGDLVEVQANCYGLDTGQLMRVVDVQGVLGEGRVNLVLWGGAPSEEKSK